MDFPVGDRIDASVDVGTGNLMVTTTDLTLPGIDRDVQLGLVYNSRLVGSTNPAAVGSAGPGWAMRLGQDNRLVINDDASVLYLAPGGLQGVFTPTSAGANTYTTPAGFKSRLVKVPAAGGQPQRWELTDYTTNAVSLFNASGLLYRINDRNGQGTVISRPSGSGGVVDLIRSSRGGGPVNAVAVQISAGRVELLRQQGVNYITREVDYGYVGGTVRTLTDVLGRTTEFDYDSSGRLFSVTNTDGISTQFLYDTSNRVTKVTRVDPTGPDAATRFVYNTGSTLVADPNTNPATAVASGPRTTYTLNATARVTKAVDPLGRERESTYTPRLDVASTTTDTGAQTAYGYGANSGESLTDVTSPTGATSTNAYANTGATQYLPSSGEDAQGNSRSYSYDGAGNLTASTSDASTAQASVTYHPDGVVATSTDPRGNVTTYARDTTTHQVTTVTPPPGAGMGATQLTWDEFGRLESVTDGRSKTTTYTYDLADRILKVDYSDSTPDVTYTYDAAGNLATRTQTGTTVTYGYDAFDQLTSRTTTGTNAMAGNTGPGTGGAVTYGYDLAGNLTSATDAATTTTYTYDTANQVTSQTSGGIRIDYAYDTNGNRTDTWFDTNTGHTTFAAHTHNDYDASGRIARTWTSRDDNNATRSFDVSYCYSPYVTGQACPTTSTDTDTGKIHWQLDHLTSQRSNFTYDTDNRLTAATNYGGHNYEYTYDAAGNRTNVKVDGTTTQTRGYNAVNQTTHGSYAYDAAGNRTSDQGGSLTLSYDAANRMTSAQWPAQGSTYTYAGTDQRELVRRVNGSGTAHTYTYGRSDRNGNPVIEAFTRGTDRFGIDYDPNGTPIMLTQPNGNKHFYVLDGQGTAQALIRDTGVETGEYTYSPYGDVLTATGPGDAAGQSVYRHTLGFHDNGTATTGYTKHGIRWNDNTTGTWTTQDPLNAPLDPANGNRYLYAAADPINNTDPTGREIDYGEACGIGAVGGAITGGISGLTGGPGGAAAGAGLGLVGGCVGGVAVKYLEGKADED